MYVWYRIIFDRSSCKILLEIPMIWIQDFTHMMQVFVFAFFILLNFASGMLWVWVNVLVIAVVMVLSGSAGWWGNDGNHSPYRPRHLQLHLRHGREPGIPHQGTYCLLACSVRFWCQNLYSCSKVWWLKTGILLMICLFFFFFWDVCVCV